MRKLIILIIIFFISCKTIQYRDKNIKIIKYKRFDVMRYDWLVNHELKEGYCIYYRKTPINTITNHIYGDFEIITYLQYNKEKDQ